MLRCLMGLNIDWFKNYGFRCKWKPRACLANFQNIETDKWTFYYHIWPFCANWMIIFHKNEIQTVILRCLTCLYLSWFKSYDTKWKKWKNSKSTKLSKLVYSCKNIFKSFHSFLWISQWKIEIQRLNISRFKAFVMINLQYEIRICQIIYKSQW